MTRPKSLREGGGIEHTEPAFYYHAGMIAKASGDTEAARGHLYQGARAQSRISARQAALARAALKELAK